MSPPRSRDLGVLETPSIEAIVKRLRDSIVTVTAGRGGTGTGVIWDNGLVVTNHHVASTSEAQVTVGGQTERARVIERDRRRDLALLELRSDSARPVSTRDAASLRVGEMVIAIGHAWGGQAPRPWG